MLTVIQNFHEKSDPRYEIYNSAAYLKKRQSAEFLKSVIKVLKSMHSGTILLVDNFDEIFKTPHKHQTGGKLIRTKRWTG